MPVYVSILTGKGYGAIGSILLCGRGAESILSGVLTPKVSFETGGIFHGRIVDGEHNVDEVIVGRERDNQFVIHCHGNPVLVQKIAELLVRHGAQIADLENAVSADLKSLLEREAYTEQLRAVTVEGVKMIQSQVGGGLSAAIKKWIDNSVSIEEIQKQCKQILERSRIARRIIGGAKIVLAGPANSGKSTLFNTLAGGQKAIVSDIAGTTRDWVSVSIHIGPLRAQIIDTAGLGDNAVRQTVDKAAQQRTIELINQCDCVLWIEDGTMPSQLSKNGFDAPVIEVWNKSDLPGGKLPGDDSEGIRISAKTGEGIDKLLSEIQKRLGVCDFDDSLPVVFTERQSKLLEAITASRHPEQIHEDIAQLAG